MAITLRSHTTGSAGGGPSTLTLNVPAGVANGDLLLAVISGYTNGISPPSGWTLVASGGTGPELAIYYRVASSEPASYGFSYSGPGQIVGTMLAYERVDASTPVNAYGIPNDGGSSQYFTANSITTTVDGCKIIACIAKQSGSTSVTVTTPATGYTMEVDYASGTEYVGVADSSQATAGATGNVVFYRFNDYTFSRCSLVALQPAAASFTPKMLVL